MAKVVIQLHGRSQAFDFRQSPPPRPFENYPGSPAIYSRSGFQELSYWLPVWSQGTEVFLRNPPSNQLSIWTDSSGRFVNASAYPTLSDGALMSGGTATGLPAGFGVNDWFVDVFFHLTTDYPETPRPADKWGIIHSYMLRRRREIIGAQLPGGPSKYIAVLPFALRSMDNSNAIMPVFMRQYLALAGEQVNLPNIVPVDDFTLFPSRATYQATDVHVRALGITYQGREMALLLSRRLGLSERSGPNPRIVAAWRDADNDRDLWIAIRHARNRRIVPSKPGMTSPNAYTEGVQTALMVEGADYLTNTQTYTRGFLGTDQVHDTSLQAQGVTKIRFRYTGSALPATSFWLNYGKSWPRGSLSINEAGGADGQYGWLMQELSNAQTYRLNRSFSDLTASLASEPAGVFFLPVQSQLGIPVQASDPGTYPGESVSLDGDPAPVDGEIIPGAVALAGQSGSTRTVEAAYSTGGDVPRVSVSVLDNTTRLATQSSVPAGGQDLVAFSGITTGSRRVGFSRVVAAASSPFFVDGDEGDFLLMEDETGGLLLEDESGVLLLESAP